MRAPLIGITTYGRDESNRFASPAPYAEGVRRAGGVPVLVPPGEPRLEELLARLDAIILAGGGDLDPALYGGEAHPEVYNVDAERDRSELALVERLVERGKPTLGICRGVQALNVALGGTLHPHLPDVVGQAVVHRLPPREPTSHPVRLVPGSRLAVILGELEFDAPSWHHQAIDHPAPGLKVVAYAPDKSIEAVEMPAHPWLIGVQWHPELGAGAQAVHQRLFDALVEAVRK
jgi:putative glutamine amidotransferase